jgi:hypothetical protein
LKIDFKYDLAKNQLKAIMEAKKDQDTYYPISIIVFDLSNDTYSQYTYPYRLGYFILKDISVEGDKKIKLISTDYDKKAIIGRSMVTSRPAHTRGLASDSYACVFYKDKETWAAVNKRYEEVAGNALFEDAEELSTSVIFLEHSFFPYCKLTCSGEDEVKYEDQVGYFNGDVSEGNYVMKEAN